MPSKSRPDRDSCRGPAIRSSSGSCRSPSPPQVPTGNRLCGSCIRCGSGKARSAHGADLRVAPRSGEPSRTEPVDQLLLLGFSATPSPSRANELGAARAGRRRMERVAAPEPPVGFDPAMIWPDGPTDPGCGFLEVVAHRILATPAAGEGSGPPRSVQSLDAGSELVHTRPRESSGSSRSPWSRRVDPATGIPG